MDQSEIREKAAVFSGLGRFITEHPFYAFLSAGTASLLLGLPSLIYPFGYDQSNQAFTAYRMLSGEVLFVDIFSLKPPLTYVLHALSQALFGHSMSSIRILDLVWTIASVAAVGWFAHKMFGRGSGIYIVLAGFFYAHYYYLFNYWHLAQVDGWMNLPIALAMVLVLKAWEEPERSSERTFCLWALIGLLSAVAMLFKYTAAGFVLIFTLAALAHVFKKPSKAALSLGGYVAGLFTVLASLVFILTLYDALDGYVSNHLAIVLNYAGHAPDSPAISPSPLWLKAMQRLFNFGHLRIMLPLVPRSYFLGLAGLLLAVGWLLSRPSLWCKRHLLLLIGWAAAGWISTAVQGRFFGYHFLPLVAPWSLLAAFFIGDLLRAETFPRAPSLPRIAVITATVAVLCLAVPSPLWPPLASHQAQAKNLAGVLSSESTLAENRRGDFYSYAPSFSVRDTLDASDYILQNTSPRDTLFVWGSNSAIYFLTRRPRVSRIHTSLQPENSRNFKVAILKEEALLEDLSTSPPNVFLVEHGDEIPHIYGHNKDSYGLLLETGRLLEFVNTNYVNMGRKGRFEILLLKQTDVPN